MKRLALVFILFIGCAVNTIAQSETAGNGTPRKEKLTDQNIGFQLNGLIRQVLNFNSSTTSTVVNPYLLTYNINSRKTGWGIRAGLGYNYNSSWSNDGITETTVNNNDLHFRLGVEKAFALSDKWSAGVGLDGLLTITDDKTTGIVRSSDTVTTITKTQMNSYGAGAMGWLRYNITSKITIGTESSIRYTTGTQTNTTDVTRQSHSTFGGPQVTHSETKSKPTISQGNIILPIAFYLAVRF